jgi:hypothetical protein
MKAVFSTTGQWHGKNESTPGVCTPIVSALGI